MRVWLAAVGRARNEPESILFQDYWRRAATLGPRAGFTGFDTAIIATSRLPGATERMREEAEQMQRRCPSGAHRIVLDEQGRSLSSEAFAQLLVGLRDRNLAETVFVIGGPDGLSSDFRKSANQQISFGAQTWPHLLVRAMLAEQVYRALTIVSGHPYHRGKR